MIKRLLSLLFFLSGSALAYTVNGNTYLTNGSQPDVQAACSSAPDNGTITVLIPNGTYSWIGNLSITHALTLAGASAGGVTINEDYASGYMINVTSSANGYTNIYWLNIDMVDSDDPDGAIGVDRTEPSSYTVLIHDCTFNGAGNYGYAVICFANGIIFWNDTFTADGVNGLGGVSFVCDKYGYGGWNTPDTFGANDTTGLNNTYLEDCTFNAGIYLLNVDDNSRVVTRYSTFNNAAWGSHGQETSIYGARIWEIYQNTFNFTSGNPDNLQGWVLVRGGTGIVTQNAMDDIGEGKSGVLMSDYAITRGMDDDDGGTFCPLAYPAPRQAGWGWSATSSMAWGIGDDTNPSLLVGGKDPGAFAPDGTGAVVDPIYVWNNTGTETTDPLYVTTYTYSPDNCGNGQVIGTYLKEGRDYYVNTTKPNWSPYTYPHPLHAKFALGNTPPPPTPTPTPSATPTPTPSATPTPTPSPTPTVTPSPTPTPTVTPTPTPSPSATPTPYSAWEKSLYSEMQSAGISSKNVKKIESWIQTNPPKP